jgi:hypothetical protein
MKSKTRLLTAFILGLILAFGASQSFGDTMCNQNKEVVYGHKGRQN